MADPNQPSGDGGQPQPSALTADQVERIAATVLNNSLTARLKTFEKQLHEKIAETVTSTVTKSLEAALPKGGEGKKGKKDGDGNEADPDSPAFKSMQRQLQEQATQLQKITQERDAERAKTRDISLRQKLAEELGKHGITNQTQQKLAMALLVDGDKRVSFAEDSDDIVFRESNGDLLDLSTGLKGWVKTDEGKHLLPPTGARGSGDRTVPGTRNANGQQQSEQQAMAEFGASLIANFGGIPVG